MQDQSAAVQTNNEQSLLCAAGTVETPAAAGGCGNFQMDRVFHHVGSPVDGCVNGISEEGGTKKKKKIK